MKDIVLSDTTVEHQVKTIVIKNIAAEILEKSVEILLEEAVDRILADKSPDQPEQPFQSVSSVLVEEFSTVAHDEQVVDQSLNMVNPINPVDLPSVEYSEIPRVQFTETTTSVARGFQPFKRPGKKLVIKSDIQTEHVESEDEPVINYSQLDNVVSTLFSLQTTLNQLKTDQFITSDSVARVKDSLDGNMKKFLRDFSDLSKDLNSKIQKSSINHIQFQEFLSSKINSVQATLSTRFDSIESKLETITVVLFNRPNHSSSMIDNKGEDSKKEYSKSSIDDLSKKRSEPKSSRRDKRPVEKISKH